MGKHDERTSFRRRLPLRVRAVAVPSVALTGASICSSAGWAEAAESLTPHALATLALLARDMYPQDHIADLFYIRAMLPWDKRAGEDPALRELILSGIDRLDEAATGRHQAAYLDLGSEADRVALLREIEGTRFFSAIRAELIVSLFAQPEVRPRFGGTSLANSSAFLDQRAPSEFDWLPTV